jgi:hypothetical protein
MTIRGWLASSYYARTRNSALLVAMLFLACAPSYTRAQAPAAALPQDAAGLVEALHKPGYDRDAVVKALLAKKAGEAVPALLDDMILQPRRERFDQRLLTQLGAKALPALLDQTEDPSRARAAARMLAMTVVPSAGASAGRLIACAKRADTRSDCGMALVRSVGPKAASAAPAIAELLRSSDREERLYAVLALKQIGVKAPAAAAALRGAVNDPDPEIYGVARKAVGWKPEKAPVKSHPAKAGAPVPAKAKPEIGGLRASTAPHRGAP